MLAMYYFRTLISAQYWHENYVAVAYQPIVLQKYLSSKFVGFCMVCGILSQRRRLLKGTEICDFIVFKMPFLGVLRVFVALSVVGMVFCGDCSMHNNCNGHGTCNTGRAFIFPCCRLSNETFTAPY